MNQKKPMATNRRLAEALARAAINRRAEQATAVNAALGKNPGLGQQIEEAVQSRLDRTTYQAPYDPSLLWPHSTYTRVPFASPLPNYVDGALTPPLTPPSENFGNLPYYQSPLPMYQDRNDYSGPLMSPYPSDYAQPPYASPLSNYVAGALAPPATPPSEKFAKRQPRFIHPGLLAPDYQPRFINPSWPDEYDPLLNDKDLSSHDQDPLGVLRKMQERPFLKNI
jgi:hypothetical protein